MASLRKSEGGLFYEGWQIRERRLNNLLEIDMLLFNRSYCVYLFSIFQITGSLMSKERRNRTKMVFSEKAEKTQSNLWRKGCMLLGLLLGYLTGNCQVLHHLSINEGLSQGFVPAVVQSKDGYIWAATLNGLNRYDGEHFITYKANPTDSFALASNRVIRLRKDQNGDMWIASEANIQIFDPTHSRFITPHYFQQFPAVNISDIGFDQYDGMWVLKKDTLLQYKLSYSQTEVTVSFQQQWAWNKENIQGRIRNFFVSDTAVYLGTGKGYVFSLNLANKRLSRLPIPVSGPVSQLWIDPVFGGLWVQGPDQAFIWKNNKIVPVSLKTPDSYPNRHGIAANGQTWLFAENNVYSWDGTVLKQLPIDLPQRVLSACTDHQNNVWLGTNTQGVFRIEMTPLHFDVLQKNNCNIRPIVLDKQGRKWVFQNDGSNINHGKYHELLANGNLGRALFEEKCQWMDVDKNGHFWVLMQHNTIAKVDNFTKVIQPIQSLGNLQAPTKIFCGEHEMVFISSSTGLLIGYDWNNNRVVPVDIFKKSGRLTQIRINFSDLITDSHGNIWVATNIGLFQLVWDTAKGEFDVINWNEKIQKNTGFSDIEIADLCQDEQQPDLFWLATPVGLIGLNTRTGQHTMLTMKDGLPDDYIFAVQPGDSTHLWLGTNRGLIELSTQDFSWRLFTEQDGLPANEFNTAAAVRSADGMLFFNTVGGIVTFHPKDLKRISNSSQMRITGLMVGNKFINSDWEKTISLKYNENALTIQFALLNYLKSAENRYEYKLEGYDENWVSAGTNNSISYAQLAPGTYTFWVRGANSGGLWSEPARLSFTIHPPWWKTWWAYTIYLIVAGTVIFLLVQFWKKMETYRRELLLSEQAEIHHTEMDQFRSRLLANITHEIRTPLTIITGLADRLTQHKDKAVEEPAQAIINSGKELLELSDQIIQLAKMDEKLFLLNPMPGEITGFIRMVSAHFYHLAQFKSITINLELPDEAHWILFDERAMRAMVTNLLSNAVKFSPVGGLIQVRLLINKPDWLTFEVQDHGIGIKQADQEKVFERFYQSSQSSSYGGSGIGLSYVKELVTQMHGTVHLESEVGQGATFTVQIPYIPTAAAAQVINTPLPTNTPIASIDIPKEENSTLPLLLLVEDNASVAAYIKSCLEEQYQVVYAVDGMDGMEKALQYIPDIIITDVMMPGMDGRELCAGLKNNWLTSHIPILMLTSLEEASNRLEGIRKGANAYITKPFQREELLLTLANLIQLREQVRRYFAAQTEAPTIITTIIEPESTPEVAAPINQEDDFMEAVLRIIEDKFADSTFSATDIMKELNVSKSQLHRKMTALTGNTASFYLRKRRLQEATRLLAQFQEMNIAQVAFAAGFSDANYFSTVFTTEFGVSPKNWRQEQGGN